MFLPFMLNTWIAATLVAVVAGVIGVFIVLRGESFMAHAIPQGSFAGAALALWLGVSPMLGMGVTAILTAVAIVLFSRHARQDVVTALMLVFMLAFGALCLALSGQYSQAVYGLLFGEVLTVDPNELPGMFVLAAVCIVTVAVLFRPLLYSSLLPDMAAARGVSSQVIALIFAVIVGLATTTTVPVVGALLMFSLLVAPPAAAVVLTRTPMGAVALSVVFALGVVWSSIGLSYTTNAPVGFYVTGLGALLYILARVLRWAWERRRGAHITTLDPALTPVDIDGLTAAKSADVQPASGVTRGTNPK